MTNECEFLIVGGGVSGLSFAHFCRTSDYLLVEADEELGGYCKTIQQDGFVWDYSGHFFHFKHPTIEAWLVSAMDSEVETIQRVANVHYRGHLIDYPFQKNIHQLPKEDFLDCLYELYFREERYPKDSAPSDFLSLLRQNFGDGITERFLRPYNEKLYACSLDQLDAQAMGRFFPWANMDEIIRNFKWANNGGYNATFTYPRGGAIQYVHALAKELDPPRISLGERVLSIDLERQEARTTHRRIRFQRLVSSMPFDRLLQTCAMDAPPEYLRYNRVLVFNLGFDRKGATGTHWTYYPDPELRFYRVGYYDNIFQSDRMSLYVEVGLPSTGEVDIDAEFQRVMRDLRTAGVLTTQQLVSWHHVVMSPAYVHISARSQEFVAQNRAVLESKNVYSIGRYGAWTYCSIEDNILEAHALAHRLYPSSPATF